MFKFLKQNKSIEIYAPVIGQVVKLEDVPDEIFANKLLGDGMAFIFETSTVFSPCDGEVVMIAETKHAIGIKTKNNDEIMIHIGLDTVNYGGEGFEVLVESGDKVNAGMPLIKIDQDFFSKNNVNMITPMIVVSKDTILKLEKVDKVNTEMVVMTLE